MQLLLHVRIITRDAIKMNNAKLTILDITNSRVHETYLSSSNSAIKFIQTLFEKLNPPHKFKYTLP